MTRLIALLSALPLLAGAATAAEFTCTFETECYETEACQPADLVIEVSSEDKEIRTEAGDFTIVAIRELRDITTVFANDRNATYLLTAVEDGARFSVHIESGPQVVTYHGICEGAF